MLTLTLVAAVYLHICELCSWDQADLILLVFLVQLDYKESWALKNWCFWIVVLEKTLESPLYCKEIQPVHPKGDQSWVFIGRTDVEAETPVLWPPDAKSWLIWKDPDAGKDWGQEEKGMTEDEMTGWHHWLNGHEFGKDAWHAAVHGVAKSRTCLSDFTFFSHFHYLIWFIKPAIKEKYWSKI